jgi:hypothetical protein
MIMMITALWSAMQQSSSTSLLLTFALIGLLLARELVLVDGTPSATSWGRILNVGIVPLLIGFAFLVAVRTAVIV